MKKTIISIALVAFMIFGGTFLTACGPQTTQNDDKLLIYTSFYPIYDFTSKIGGDKVEVVNLVKAGQEPHDYSPTTQDLVGLEDSDLIIINGLEMEEWIESLSTTITSKIVDTSQGVTTLERTETDTHEEEEHEEDEHDHEHSNIDPHIWLSLRNAKIQLKNIKDALVNLDSENADYYENNFAKYSLLFDGLDYQYTQVLSAVTNANIVVSHRAFSYLANDYSLNQFSLSDVETDTEPTLAKMQEIIDFVNNNNIKGVFYQEYTSPEVINQIQSETGAKVYKLYAAAGLTQAQIDAGEDYLSIMAQNLVNLEKALV